MVPHISAIVLGKYNEIYSEGIDQNKYLFHLLKFVAHTAKLMFTGLRRFFSTTYLFRMIGYLLIRQDYF